MDLIDVASEINIELGKICVFSERTLSQQRRAGIFNSVVSCLTEGWADLLYLSIISSGEPQEVLAQWTFDIHKEELAQRSGPELPEILKILGRTSSPTTVDCRFKPSRKFMALDRHAQAHALKGTIWGVSDSLPTHDDELDRSRVGHDDAQLPSRNPAILPSTSADLGELAGDLEYLSVKTKLLDDQAMEAVAGSVRQLIEVGAIAGVEVILIASNSRQPVRKCRYIVESQTIRRALIAGESIQDIALAAKELRGKAQLAFTPLFSKTFTEQSQEDKARILATTVWPMSSD